MDDKNTINEQFRSAYKVGMGFLMPHFLDVTGNKKRYDEFNTLITRCKNYFIEADNADLLLQVASFVVHKNSFYLTDNKYPSFRGFSFYHYKKLMDDMMSKSVEYDIAKENEILMIYFPRDIHGCDNILPVIAPIISSRDSVKQINLVLTTNPNVHKYFKEDDMSERGRLIYTKLSVGKDGCTSVRKENSTKFGENF